MSTPHAIEVQYHDSGLLADHEEPCHVCWLKSAVLDMHTNRFQPCWDCQKIGWSLVLVPGWLRWLESWLR